MTSRLLPSLSSLRSRMFKEAENLLEHQNPSTINSALGGLGFPLAPHLGLEHSRIDCWIPKSISPSSPIKSTLEEQRDSPLSSPSQCLSVFYVKVTPDLCPKTDQVVPMATLSSLSDLFTSIHLRGFTPHVHHKSVGLEYTTKNSMEKTPFTNNLLNYTTQTKFFEDPKKESGIYCVSHISRLNETSATTSFQLYSFSPRFLFDSRNDNLYLEAAEVGSPPGIVTLPPIPHNRDNFHCGDVANWIIRCCPPYATGVIEKVFV